MKNKILNYSIKGRQTKVVDKDDLVRLFGFLKSAEENLEKLQDELQEARIIVHKMGKDFYRGYVTDRIGNTSLPRLGTEKKKSEGK